MSQRARAVMSGPAAAISVFRCARLGWKPFNRRLDSPASKPPMNAPTRRRAERSDDSTFSKSFRCRGQNAATTAPVIKGGDPALQVGQRGRHLGVRRVSHPPTLGLYGPNAAIARGEKRFAL